MRTVSSLPNRHPQANRTGEHNEKMASLHKSATARECGVFREQRRIKRTHKRRIVRARTETVSTHRNATGGDWSRDRVFQQSAYGVCLLVLLLAALPRIVVVLAAPQAAPLIPILFYFLGTALNFFHVRDEASDSPVDLLLFSYTCIGTGTGTWVPCGIRQFELNSENVSSMPTTEVEETNQWFWRRRSTTPCCITCQGTRSHSRITWISKYQK